MAANVSLLMSLIANALGSGIVFFSGPPADLAYLQSNTNISIYEVDRLSPTEEKALGDNNIFFDFNQQTKGKLDDKLTQLASQHVMARIFRAHQGLCSHETLNTTSSDITNRNKTHLVFHVCQFNATTFLLNVLGGESFIKLNGSAVDSCGRTIGYQTSNVILKPSMMNMLDLSIGKLCLSDRYCLNTKRKQHNTSNPLILKSPNCYNDCTDKCPEGHYQDHCDCRPKYYDWREHLRLAYYHPGAILFVWLLMATTLSTFCLIYFSGSVDKLKYLFPLFLQVASFSAATLFTYRATLDEAGYKTGHCPYYLTWLHLFTANIPVNRLLTYHHDRIPKPSRLLTMFVSLSLSGIFILLQLVWLDAASSICFGPSSSLATLLFEIHFYFVCIWGLVGHFSYSSRTALLGNLLDAVLEMVYMTFLDLVFKSSSVPKYARDSLEILTKTFKLSLEMSLSMLNSRGDAIGRLRMETVRPAPEAPAGELHQTPLCPLQLRRKVACLGVPVSVPSARQATQFSSKRANTI